MADNKDIQKSVEETVNQILSADTAAANGGSIQQIADPTAQDSAAKAMPASNPANGGEDKIRSGSPMSEEQKAEEAKKAKEAKEKEEKEEEDEEEAKKAMADKDKDADDKDKKKEAKEADACKAKMKKSLAELAEILEEDELELIKSWREECEAEAVAKSQTAAQPSAMQMTDLQEVLKKAISEQTADIKKSLDEKDTLIKGLNEKIEKMASQPAYDRRSKIGRAHV